MTVRSAGSNRWAIVEAALSTIVFGYATKRVVDSLCGQNVEVSSGELARGWLMFLPVLLCIGCTLCTGVSHLVCPASSRAAVTNIESVNAHEMKRLGRGKWADSLGVDGLDLFEYHEVITAASYISKVISVWILVVCFVLLLFFGAVLVLMLSFHFPLGPTLCKAIAAYLLASFFTFFLCSVAGRVWKSAGTCRTQPFHSHARAWLLVPTSVYAVLLLYLSLAPSTWRWSLIVTHTTRALKVLASLRGQEEVLVETGGEDEGDML